jgi:ABC-type transport system substrate-binding protein
MEANANYRDATKPAFASAVIKGGGDAEGSARAVMSTGEFDYAWNTQIAPDSQAAMAAEGKGVFVVAFGTLVERLEMNMTDPSADLPEGERATVKHPHPFLTDINVRKALSMAIDRQTLTEVGYGAGGAPSCNIVPAPALYASDNTGCLTQDIEGAKALLEAAGWVDTNGDGIRDFVTGKRFWSHAPRPDGTGGEEGTHDPAVLYWYEVKPGKTSGKAEFIPHLIHNDSGVGTQVTAVDVDGTGVPDVVVGTKKGCFVSFGTRN